MVHNRRGRGSFQGIFHRVKSWLSTWKASCLNMAGRITLASSVLSVISQYAIHTCLVPKYVCSAIEKIIRGFIWRDSNEGRRVQLIKWDIMCRSKSLGGVGIRSLEKNNIASMAKLAWWYVTEENTLWVTLMRERYQRKSHILDSAYKPGDSQV